MADLIPKNKHAIIKMCKLILKVDGDITEDHLKSLQMVIKSHLDDGLSPADIKRVYDIRYTDFGMFIKKCLNLQLKSTKDAVINHVKRSGRAVTDEKTLYHNACQFKFDPYSMKSIPNYALLLEKGLYHPLKNPNGVCRDHMVSIAYGWRHGIDPSIISHPCNCQYLTNAENISKNDKSCMSIEQLTHRISNLEMSLPVLNESRSLPKSDDHKKKIRDKNALYMVVTNGVENIRMLKTDPIPDGFRIGLTRKLKMVPGVGVEPTCI